MEMEMEMEMEMVTLVVYACLIFFNKQHFPKTLCLFHNVSSASADSSTYIHTSRAGRVNIADSRPFTTRV